MQTALRDRLTAGLGTVIILALLGYVLFLGLSVDLRRVIEQPLALLDLRALPPKPPVRHPVERKTAGTPAAASPRALKAKATPIVVPPPLIMLPAPPTLIVAPRPGIGAAASAGASDRPGPGQGAGGRGDGTGDGGDGNGDGGGDTPPRQIKGRLKISDMPGDLPVGFTGGTVAVRFTVETDGHVTHCTVTGSSGNAELDGVTCRLIEQRYRFDPCRDPQGRPILSTVVENHSWTIEREPQQTGG